jgi:hypothetical protein
MPSSCDAAHTHRVRYLGGAFTAGEGKPLIEPQDLPNCNMRLYGGAQFHRTMAEFRVGVGQMACPTVTKEEIVNACGMVRTNSEDCWEGGQQGFVSSCCWRAGFMPAQPWRPWR